MDEFPVTSRTEPRAVARDSLARALRAALDDASSLIQLTSEAHGAELAAARMKTQASIEHARVELDRVQEAAMRRSYDLSTGVNGYLQANPWQAVALAGVVSVIVGLLVSRR